MSFAKVIYALIAVLCIIPLPIAEYRRIVLGKFDAQYWLMAAPILVTCFFLYRMIAGEKIREEKERINEAKRNGLDYEDKLLKIRTDAMTVCCVVVAIVAFASSGIINLFF
jgi:amino acid permease